MTTPSLDVRRVNFVPISFGLRPMVGVGHVANLPAVRAEINLEVGALQLYANRNVVTLSAIMAAGVKLTGVQRPSAWTSYGVQLRWQPSSSVFGYDKPRLGGYGTAQITSEGGVRLSFGAELVVMPGMSFNIEMSNDFILTHFPSANTTLSAGWRLGLFE